MFLFIKFFIIMIYSDKSYFIFLFFSFCFNFFDVVFFSLFRWCFSFLCFAFMFLFIRFFIIRIYFELCDFFFFIFPIQSLTSSISYLAFSIFLPNDPSFLHSTKYSSSSVSVSSFYFYILRKYS